MSCCDSSSLKRSCCVSELMAHRKLTISDNLGTVSALSKGRSSSFSMNRLCKVAAAYQLFDSQSFNWSGLDPTFPWSFLVRSNLSLTFWMISSQFPHIFHMVRYQCSTILDHHLLRSVVGIFQLWSSGVSWFIIPL